MHFLDFFNCVTQQNFVRYTAENKMLHDINKKL